MIKNVKLSKRLLSMLAGAVIGVTPLAATSEAKETTGFTLVKQEMKIEGNDLNLDNYTKELEATYNYLKQFINYDNLQADLQCLYYIANRTYMSTDVNNELTEYGAIYGIDNVKNNFENAFALISKINEYNENTIRNDYQNNTMDINHLIDISKLCFDEHDRNIVRSMFENYFNAYKNKLFDNEDYTAVFKELTTLNSEERLNNAHELQTGAMWISQITIGREVMEMLHDDMLNDYSIEELSKYFVREELEKGNWILRDDVSFDLNCLSELEYEIFNLGELETFCYNQVNNNIFRIFEVSDVKEQTVINETETTEVKETNNNTCPEVSLNDTVSFDEGVKKAYDYLSAKVSYDHLQTDLQCLYYLANREYLGDVESDLINNGIVFETNFETEEGLQNFMQAYSLINVILDYNQSVIRDDYENNTMDINHLIDPSIICMNSNDRNIVHMIHVSYFEAYKNGRFENQNYYEVLKELVSNSELSVGSMWLARNIIGGDTMQMLRDDMQEDFERKELDKYFIAKELNKGQWLLRDDINVSMNDTEELSREVYNFKELWAYVYDNVNNDLFMSFQVNCNVK